MAIPTSEQLYAEAEIEARLERNRANKLNAIASADRLRGRLRDCGWTRYREGELISPDRQVVVRTGYAGGEIEVEVKRPRDYQKIRPVKPGRLRLYRGEPHEMQAEIDVFLAEHASWVYA